MRTQEGRVELFLLAHPTLAERLFRRAIELDPEMPEPYYLLWQVKDLTGRAQFTEPEFWKVYEASTVQTKGIRLRDWYMCQFYPATANMPMDKLMGIVPVTPSDPTKEEPLRLVRFIDGEPESPVCRAALARLFQREGNARAALEILEKDAAEVRGAEEDPFYLATLIGILIELGDLDRADRCFQAWPEPRTGYEYWLTQGKVLQEIRAVSGGE